MFVLQKQLSVLNVPSSRVALIYRSGADIQLALPDLPSQLGSAYLVMLKGGGKVQVLVGLFLAKSRRNIFYVSDSGEVPPERADREFEDGQIFAESMGFILNDTDSGRLTPEQLALYWKGLPICQRHAETATEPSIAAPQATSPKVLSVAVAPSKATETQQTGSANPVSDKVDLSQKRQLLKARLGRFLASL